VRGMYSSFAGSGGREDISRALRREEILLLEYSIEEAIGWAKVAFRIR
jgi:hypothetical protein